MESPRERSAEGLQVGDRFNIVRWFTLDDIRQLAQISRDYNPFTAMFATRNCAGSRRP